MHAHGEAVNGKVRTDLPVAGQPGPPDVPAARLVATLAVAGALAGLLIVSVFQWAQPRILANRALVLAQAIEEVLQNPARYDTLYVVDGALAPQAPEGADLQAIETVYFGYDDDGAPIGFAVTGAEPGFQDFIRLIFGYDAANERLLGMKVLESKETPGLGDKIEKDSAFVGEFVGVATPLEGVKAGSGSGAEQEIDMITGATISSRAIIDIINHRLEALGPVLREYRTGDGS